MTEDAGTSPRKQSAADPAEPAKKRRWLRWVIAVPLSIALALYLARDPIATKLVSRALSKRGTTCEGLAVHVGWTLQSVSIGETTCRRAEGRVTELAFPEGATLELAGLSPRRVSAPALRVELREAPDTLEDAGLALFDDALAREPLTNVLTAVAHFAERPDRIDLAFDRVELGREGRALVASDVIARRTDEGLHVTVSELRPRARARTITAWRLRALEARATASEVDGRATLIVDVSVAGLGREERVGVVVRGRTLDADADVSFSLQTSPAVRALRDRAARLRDRLRERRR